MSQQRLLIVEDSDPLRDALRTFFEWHGYLVSSAASVDDGIAAAESAQHDIMLLDLSLPDGHGLAVLEALKQRNIPLPTTVALTGDENQLTREACLAAGCRDVVEKPVPTRTLLALVQSL